MDTKPVPAFAAKYAVASDIGQPLDEELADSVNYLMSHHLEEKTLEDTELIKNKNYDNYDSL